MWLFSKTNWTTTLRRSKVPDLPSRVIRTDAVAGFPWSGCILFQRSLLDKTHCRGLVHSSPLPCPSSFSGDHSGFFHVMICTALLESEAYERIPRQLKRDITLSILSRCLLCGTIKTNCTTNWWRPHRLSERMYSNWKVSLAHVQYAGNLPADNGIKG